MGIGGGADLVPSTASARAAAAGEAGWIGDFSGGRGTGDGWDVGDVDDPLGGWGGDFCGLHGVQSGWLFVMVITEMSVLCRGVSWIGPWK